MNYNKFKDLKEGDIVEYYSETGKATVREVLVEKVKSSPNYHYFNSIIIFSTVPVFKKGQKARTGKGSKWFKIVSKVSNKRVFEVLFGEI